MNVLLQMHDNTGSESFASTEIKGQTFELLNDIKLYKVTLLLSKTGVIGDVILQIQETTNGLPNGTVVKSATIDGDALTTSCERTDFIFDIKLTAGTYALVIKAPDQAIKLLVWRIGAGVCSGSLIYSDDDGENWDFSTGYNCWFEIVGEFTESKGTKWIRNSYPVEEGTTARTTKQTTKRFLTPQKSFVVNG